MNAVNKKLHELHQPLYQSLSSVSCFASLFPNNEELKKETSSSSFPCLQFHKSLIEY